MQHSLRCSSPNPFLSGLFSFPCSRPHNFKSFSILAFFVDSPHISSSFSLHVFLLLLMGFYSVTPKLYPSNFFFLLSNVFLLLEVNWSTLDNVASWKTGHMELDHPQSSFFFFYSFALIIDLFRSWKFFLVHFLLSSVVIVLLFQHHAYLHFFNLNLYTCVYTRWVMSMTDNRSLKLVIQHSSKL